MSVSYLRPPVGDLIFRLYARPLHPELFDILAVRALEREDYKLTVRITRTGHFISWDSPNVHLTEVTAAAGQSLPRGKRLLHYKIRQEQCGRLVCAHGVRYEMSFQVEVLAPPLFEVVHEELVADGRKRGMLLHFPSGSRLAPAPLALVTADARNGCLLLSTFHTFPGEYTVVKTQSLIERNRP
jgi:hypothetical protein